MSYPFEPRMTKLELQALFKNLGNIFKKLSIFPQGSLQTLFTMEDTALSAFSVFRMQNPSFWAWLRYMQEQTRYHYFKSWDDLFYFMLINLELSPTNLEEILFFETG